jgi:DNA-binding NarL/FixJ family response regulator
VAAKRRGHRRGDPLGLRHSRRPKDPRQVTPLSQRANVASSLSEKACALAETADPELIRQPIALFAQLGAHPAIAHAIHRLRALGVRDPAPLGCASAAPPGAGPQDLSTREREVLRLLAAGRTDREIAQTLFISPRTASKHVGAILAKLAVASRAEAAVRAVQCGLV